MAVSDSLPALLQQPFQQATLCVLGHTCPAGLPASALQLLGLTGTNHNCPKGPLDMLVKSMLNLRASRLSSLEKCQ